MQGKRVIYLIMIASITALTILMAGCAPGEEAEDEQDDQAKNDVYEYEVKVQADSKEAGAITGEGIYEKGEEVFNNIYFEFPEFGVQVSTDLLTDEIKKEVLSGEYSVHHKYPLSYPDHISEASSHIEEIILKENSVIINARYEFPHINSDKYRGLKDELTDEIISRFEDDEKEGQGLDLLFKEIIGTRELDMAETKKSMEIKKVDQELKVTAIDKPDELFSSFEELYEKTVADQVDYVKVKAGKDIEAIEIKFAGETLETEREEDIGLISSFIDPHYLLDDVSIVLPNNAKIPLKTIWEPLAEKDREMAMNYSFDSFLNNFSFMDDPDREKLFFHSNHSPPPGGSIHSIFGVLDLHSKDFEVFKHTRNGGSFMDLEWSPTGNYVYYLWRDMGGVTNLEIYDEDTDEIYKIEYFETYDEKEKVDNFIRIPEDKLPDNYEEKHQLNFTNVKWGDEGKKLYFDIKEKAYVDDEWRQIHETEVISYKFYVEESNIEVINH